MTQDLHVRTEGRAGRITFTRPQALNALSHPMALALEAALETWRDAPQIELVIIDAEGERAFCAGGDIAEMYRQGAAANYDGPQGFWRDEYRMNAKIAEYGKPIVALMNGFVMGGGVGVGGLCSHRVVGDSTQMAMPECGIGLIPDVGGTYLLSRAPGRIGEYLGLTGARMGAGDAIHAGFADSYLPEGDWPALIAALCESGDVAALEAAARPAPEAGLAAERAWIDTAFAAPDLAGVRAALEGVEGETAERARKALARNSPLSMAATLEMVRRARGMDTVREALVQEYRFTHRSMEDGDFLEGVRAQIIDKDRNPQWRHRDVSPEQVEAILAPLGERELTLD